MIARTLIVTGVLVATIGACAEPPVTALWVPAVVMCLAGWSRAQSEPQRAARRRRDARKGWIHG